MRVQGLEKSFQLQIPLPKNREVLDGIVTGLMFSRDSRFISWTAYSRLHEKKVLRLADTRTGRVFDLQSANGSSVLMEEKLPFPIVSSPDGKTVYLTGNVQKSANLNDFSHGIAEVDLESGKIKRSQHQYAGVGISHVKDNIVFLKNASQETRPLLQWDRPLDIMSPFPNTIAVSPDGRWYLTYDRDGLTRVKTKP